jgi:hypothetical protein
VGFAEGIKQLEAYIRATSINVLVWGAGSGEHLEKRLKVQEVLRAQFPNSDVRFSEDPELNKFIPGGEELTIPQQELWHLGACDVCVVLDTSIGPGEEIAHFTGSQFASRLLIFTHEKYRGSTSFPGFLRENQNQVFYTQTEYDSCNVVDRIVSRVKIVALGKYARISVT